MGIYAFSLITESNSANSALVILLCFFSIALPAMALFIIIIRNRTYARQKRIEMIYNNKCQKINELQNEYTALMNHDSE